MCYEITIETGGIAQIGWALVGLNFIPCQRSTMDHKTPPPPPLLSPCPHTSPIFLSAAGMSPRGRPASTIPSTANNHSPPLPIDQDSNANVTVKMLTALHLAASAPTCGTESKRAMRQLLMLAPETVSIPNPANDCLPLHYLCDNESKQHWVNDGIHRACAACCRIVRTGVGFVL